MVVQSIFTNQIPASIDLSDSNYTLGTLFIADVPGSILGIRTYIANLNNSGTVGSLYQHINDAEGTLLMSKSFGALTKNSWNSVLFDTPVPIVAGQKYMAAYTTGQYVATGGFFNGTAVVNGHLTSPATAFNSRNGKYYVGGLHYPDQEFNGSCYFVDVLFQAQGDEPSPKKDTNRFFFGAN